MEGPAELGGGCRSGSVVNSWLGKDDMRMFDSGTNTAICVSIAGAGIDCRSAGS